SNTERAFLSAEDARIRVGTALALLELAAEVFAELPPPEAALRLGDRELYRYLHAGQRANAWLVGQEPGDALERPNPGSALGEGESIYQWTEAEVERAFTAAVRAWSERQ
ncbi:MAG: hypothetical protein ACLF0P_15120, partial [Thermoanaerobaculia bacterium]